jgi:hypothetical protein
MSNQPLTAPSASPAQMAAIPPGFLMWAGIYSVMFYVCGGMIAALYDPRSR